MFGFVEEDVCSKAFSGIMQGSGRDNIVKFVFFGSFSGYFQEDLIVFSQKSGVTMIQNRGVYLPQLISLVYNSIESGASPGIVKEMPMTIGIGGLFV